MKGNLLRPLSLVIASALVIVSIPSVCMADQFDETISNMQQQEQKTQETISNLEKQTQATRESIALLEEQKKNTQDNVNSLKDQSASLQSTIEGYSDKLEDLDDEIDKTENEMSRVSSEIVTLNSELNDIRSQIKERQDLLKNRMKSVYERGGSKGMLQSIVTANTFKDVLNRYVYLDAMISYDKQKISECQALEQELENKKAEVEKKEAELDAYQDNLDDKYSELSDLSDEARSRLDSTNSSIDAETGKLVDFDAKLAQLDKTMKSLESQVAAAQAQLAKQIAERLSMKREDTSGAYTASASELEWLAATIQAEAGGESYTGKLAVGSVIMNRVKSSAFPNSVVGVITQNMQFASYRSGKVELIIANGPNSTCIKAAQEVLDGARVGDYLFFMTKYYADYYRISEYTMIGNHAFFYKWVVKDPEPVYEAPEESPEGAPEETPTEAPAEGEQEAPAEEQPPEQEQDEGEGESDQ